VLHIPHGSLASTVLANNTGSDDPILLTALMRNLYSLFGVRSSHLYFVGSFGGICATVSQPPVAKKKVTPSESLVNVVKIVLEREV
jgi:hypothetical protein